MVSVMQKNKPRLLCTNPIGQLLIQQAAQKGLVISVLPFIETESLPGDELREIISGLSQQAATVVFTSLNAVEAVKTYLSNLVPRWKIWCTGGITQKSVREYFGEQAVSGTQKGAIELAESILAFGSITEVVFFCGDQRRNELPAKLTGQGIKVKEIIVYHTAAMPHQVFRHYDGITFFSPSAVHSFFSVNKIDNDTILFAIGKTTADTIKPYSNNKVIVGESPGKEMLIKKAIDYFQTHPIHR
jgi:uroporphyrinogen-III synthase